MTPPPRENILGPSARSAHRSRGAKPKGDPPTPLCPAHETAICRRGTNLTDTRTFKPRRSPPECVDEKSSSRPYGKGRKLHQGLVPAATVRRPGPPGGGGPKHRVQDPPPAPGTSRHRWHQHLPVLRRRLRPVDLRQERQAVAYRGRSAQPGEPGHPVPQGRQHPRRAAVAATDQQGAVPRPARHRLGREAAGLGDGAHRPSDQADAGRQLRPRTSPTAAPSTTASASPRSAAQPSTTRKTTSSRNCSAAASA